MPQAIAQMFRRRGMANLDMDAAGAALAKLSQEELAAVDADYLYEHFFLGEHVALPEHRQTMALPAPRERLNVAFGTQDPYVSALILKCRLSYAAVTQLQMRHGADVQAYIDELQAYAEQNNIDISKVLARSSLPLTNHPDTDFGSSAPAPPEPEFTEVVDEPIEQPTEAEKDDLFAGLKAEFDVRKDS
jgi:hypothetical protein